MNAALLVKGSSQEWEVVAKYNLPKPKFDEFMAAYESGNPITGMITTTHGEAAVPGAIWNGTSFSGGTKSPWMDETVDWSVIGTYALISDNKILISFTGVKNDIGYDKMEAAFGSEVTLVPITLGQNALLGSIWNGQDFIAKA